MRHAQCLWRRIGDHRRAILGHGRQRSGGGRADPYAHRHTDADPRDGRHDDLRPDRGDFGDPVGDALRWAPPTLTKEKVVDLRSVAHLEASYKFPYDQDLRILLPTNRAVEEPLQIIGGATSC